MSFSNGRKQAHCGGVEDLAKSLANIQLFFFLAGKQMKT
jgi:hypothetical protein